MRVHSILALLCAGLVFAVVLNAQLLGPAPVTAADGAAKSLDSLYGRVEMSFEANWGQADPGVKFLARGSGYSLLLTPTEAILATSRLNADPGRDRALPGRYQAGDWDHSQVRMRVAGANTAAKMRGEDLLPGRTNYFSGPDPAAWRTGIPTYRAIRVEDVYSGVDLVYYGNQRELEFDFVVAPGASPESIRLSYEGVEELRVDPGGDLVLRTKLGELRQQSPTVYQEVDGQLRAIAANHVLLGGGEVGFHVRGYDRKRPLVIDPKLGYSTLLGGSSMESPFAIAVDSSGNAYVTGMTVSTSFPVVSAYQRTAGQGLFDVFITKLNPTGTALVYSTYLHGDDGAGIGEAIAVDSSGSAYVGGVTTATKFPTTAGALQTTTRDTCCTDAFLVKLSPNGSQLTYSTYIAGSKGDEITGLKVDSRGAVFAVGATESTASFPIRGGFQTANAGDIDAFILKLEPTGASLAYSTFLGGPDNDWGSAVAVDDTGNAFIAGWTESTAFPKTTGAWLPTAGERDAFIVKVNSTGAALTYSSRFGGTNDDAAGAVAVDAQGNAYVTGRTASANFPVTAGAYQAANRGRDDVFAVKLNPSGGAPVYSTLLGGAAADWAYGLSLDSSGNAYIAGRTESTDFPVSADAIQKAYGGGGDAFVAKVNATGSALPFSSYLGGSNSDSAYGIALDRLGFAYLAGDTEVSNFPTTEGAYQTARRGTNDVFITKIDFTAQTTATLAIISGNSQTGTVGTALPAPLVVELRNAAGPISGAVVTFAATGATMNPASVQTGSNGRASSVAIPTAAGAVTVNATAPGAAPVVFTATAQAAPAPVTLTSAASFRGGAMAPGMLAVIWGQGFTSGAHGASSLPLPTTLGGVTVAVRDSTGTELLQPLIFASATQINFYLLAETQGGPATVRITGADARVQTANISIESVNPGLFTLNSDGQGIVAGNGIRVDGTGAQTVFELMQYDATQRKWVGRPIDFGPPVDRIFLVLYGTGLRNRTSLANVNATVGGVQVQPEYLGSQGSLVGLDQFNFELPRSTKGRGEIPVSLTVDGKTANTVTVTVGP